MGRLDFEREKRAQRYWKDMVVAHSKLALEPVKPWTRAGRDNSLLAGSKNPASVTMPLITVIIPSTSIQHGTAAARQRGGWKTRTGLLLKRRR